MLFQCLQSFKPEIMGFVEYMIEQMAVQSLLKGVFILLIVFAAMLELQCDCRSFCSSVSGLNATQTRSDESAY